MGRWGHLRRPGLRNPQHVACMRGCGAQLVSDRARRNVAFHRSEPACCDGDEYALRTKHTGHVCISQISDRTRHDPGPKPAVLTGQTQPIPLTPAFAAAILATLCPQGPTFREL